ncbi:hypothetical protein EZY14_010690 [Kordia sp. TARA_039_SRF]|nr:hypothetical protein EZY14_010690 [Kordia sp. TARA_039_SRF]
MNKMSKNYNEKLINSLNFVNKFLDSSTFNFIEKIEKQSNSIIENSTHRQLSSLIRIQKSFLNRYERLLEDPEFQFLIIVDNHYEEIEKEKIFELEEIVERKLSAYLVDYEVENIWKGVNYALKSNFSENPDRVRHFLVSLRTILEYSLEHIIVPKEKIKGSGEFNEKLKAHKKEHPESTKIPRKLRLEYLANKFDFKFKEFSTREINFINELYKKASYLHSKDISFKEIDLRVLKNHVGITLWLLFFIYEDESAESSMI